MTSTPQVLPDSLIEFQPLLMRPDDDDEDVVVIGRADIGEFVEIPAPFGTAIELLQTGMSVAAAEEALLSEHDMELDVTELVETVADAGFVRSVDGTRLADPAQDAPKSHFPRITSKHVGWIFSWPMKALWAVLLVSAAVSVALDSGVAPHYSDFFWTDYIGFAVLVNTLMFSVSISMHEMMHLVAARSLGSPGRVGFGTRLHNLVVQTDVTGIWGVPRRSRYRVYLAGMIWDLAAFSTLLLLVSHASLPGTVRDLLQAAALTIILSMPLQLQVYMRTDLYFVLRDFLRCRNLFDDGMGYARYLFARCAAKLRRSGTARTDPTVDLTPRARRATRVYACFLVFGSTLTLTFAAVFGIPITVKGISEAWSAVRDYTQGGPVLPAVDATLLVLVEGGIQALFLITFVKSHPHWFRWVPRFRSQRAET